ncbi:MAG: 4'-phosphopantetheinyl transferase [Acidobacteria bacterium]|nr:MAG: 4'-phosphopantetheinyl transferase [Acidobacteriota bacterium]
MIVSKPRPAAMIEWVDRTEPLPLSRDQVHLWKIRLNRAESDILPLKQTLTPDELARAGRFFFERDRRRFTAARGQLRLILGRYLGTRPGDLQFSYGDCGKPFFIQPASGPSIKFNLSHSGERALLGVTLDREIGVDLEQIHSLEDADVIAERFFSPGENARLLAVPREERLQAFFCCWTLKEAYVKATGDGLVRPTQSFDVEFGCGRARLLHIDGHSQEALRWSLVDLAPERRYVGGLAVEGHGWSLVCSEVRI